MEVASHAYSSHYIPEPAGMHYRWWLNSVSFSREKSFPSHRKPHLISSESSLFTATVAFSLLFRGGSPFLVHVGGGERTGIVDRRREKRPGARLGAVRPPTQLPSRESCPPPHLHDGSLRNSKTEELTREELIAKVNQLQEIVSQLETTNNSTTEQSATQKKQRKQKPQRNLISQVQHETRWSYDGFQSQDTTDNTIEARLFEALTKTRLIEKRQTSNYHRCGRTDKGVSAFGQRAQVSSPDLKEQPTTERRQTKTTEIKYVYILNKVLPPDIRVLAWAPVDPDFSARFSCQQRTYKYFFPKGTWTSSACIWCDACVAVLFLIGQGQEENRASWTTFWTSTAIPGSLSITWPPSCRWVLYDSTFDGVSWIYDHDTHEQTLHHLQKVWCGHVIKTNIVKSMLDSLEKVEVQKDGEEGGEVEGEMEDEGNIAACHNPTQDAAVCHHPTQYAAITTLKTLLPANPTQDAAACDNPSQDKTLLSAITLLKTLLPASPYSRCCCLLSPYARCCCLPSPYSIRCHYHTQDAAALPNPTQDAAACDNPSQDKTLLSPSPYSRRCCLSSPYSRRCHYHTQDAAACQTLLRTLLPAITLAKTRRCYAAVCHNPTQEEAVSHNPSQDKTLPSAITLLKTLLSAITLLKTQDAAACNNPTQDIAACHNPTQDAAACQNPTQDTAAAINLLKTLLPAKTLLKTFLPAKTLLKTLLPVITLLKTLLPAITLLKTLLPDVTACQNPTQDTAAAINLLKTLLPAKTLLKTFLPAITLLKTLLPVITLLKTLLPDVTACQNPSQDKMLLPAITLPKIRRYCLP
ncbi:tRNA pseudouridine synthase 3 [Branchiostoma belcheri]|nr:tRNA pseudouridine synthase 3 [Branchiostoma belcheri]